MLEVENLPALRFIRARSGGGDGDTKRGSTLRPDDMLVYKFPPKVRDYRIGNLG